MSNFEYLDLLTSILRDNDFEVELISAFEFKTSRGYVHLSFKLAENSIVPNFSRWHISLRRIEIEDQWFSNRVKSFTPFLFRKDDEAHNTKLLEIFVFQVRTLAEDLESSVKSGEIKMPKFFASQVTSSEENNDGFTTWNNLREMLNIFSNSNIQQRPFSSYEERVNFVREVQRAAGDLDE